MTMPDQERRDLIAQWAFDTRAILGRFHLWLEDVEERWTETEVEAPDSFVGPALEHAFVVAAAVTALGTRLFGGHGNGKGLDRQGINRAKKDADAVSAYAISEALWYLTRSLPENHGLLVSLGEGLMPKAGETPEMGSNPEVGFGRVYARAEVARYLDSRVHGLINRSEYGWEEFWGEIKAKGVTVWGAALDTLENTSRFAKGDDSGPMSLLHVFDQPLEVAAPYEGYVGTLTLPRQVVEEAARRSVLITYDTPRAQVFEAIRQTYPDIEADCVHVWTLGGPHREHRLGGLWGEWRDVGVHLVEQDWPMPGGGPVFTDSGTYAPVFRVGTFEHEGRRHLFLCDGYAASAEAIQAASLDPILDTHSAMRVFSSQFKLPAQRERHVMALDPESPRFAEDLEAVAGEAMDPELVEQQAGPGHRRLLPGEEVACVGRGELHAARSLPRHSGGRARGRGHLSGARARGHSRPDSRRRADVAARGGTGGKSAGVLSPAGALRGWRGPPHTTGQGVGLGPGPERAADPLLRGFGVPGQRTDPCGHESRR